MRVRLRAETGRIAPHQAWPMVEAAAAGRQSASTRGPGEADTREHIQALEAEARTGLVRGGPPSPSLDRETARALVEAGYMPLPDYLAMYGHAADRQDADWSQAVAARFAAAAPRRNVYRATSVRYALPKASDRVFNWRRRA